MYQGLFQSSPVKQMVSSGNPTWLSINNMRPPPHHHNNHHHSFMASPPHHYFPPQLPPALFAAASWNESQELQESFCQPLLGGLVGEEDKLALSHKQAKIFENCDKKLLDFSPKSKHSQQESFSLNLMRSLSNSDSFMKCNATGGAAKRAKIQSSSAISTIKVRKEKLGDRITALHQLVSPFGKTDTASVLLEAIGYIKFLQNQIEALSLPYLGRGIRQQHHPLRTRNCTKRKGISDDLGCDEESRKDLRSRGLCLVPISCTLHAGSGTVADYWGPKSTFGPNIP